MTNATPKPKGKGFWGSIGSFFKKGGYYAGEAWHKVFNKEVVQHLAVVAWEVVHSELGKLAKEVVNEVELMAAGTDKKSVGFAKLTWKAIAAGLDVKKSLIGLALEFAVQELQGNFGKGTDSGLL